MTAHRLEMITREHVFATYGWGKFENMRISTVKFLTERKSHSTAALSKIRCPVKLLVCAQDVAYGLSYYEEFCRQLKDALVDVSLDVVDAPHFGTVTRADLYVLNRFADKADELTNLIFSIDPILANFIAQHTDKDLVPIPKDIKSPFEDRLMKFGWKPDDSDDEDTNEFFFPTQLG